MSTDEHITFAEPNECVYVSMASEALFVEVLHAGFMVAAGGVGPAGEALAGGTPGQFYSVHPDGIHRLWVDPPTSAQWGLIEGDIEDQDDVMALAATLMAFAAAQG